MWTKQKVLHNLSLLIRLVGAHFVSAACGLIWNFMMLLILVCLKSVTFVTIFTLIAIIFGSCHTVISEQSRIWNIKSYVGDSDYSKNRFVEWSIHYFVRTFSCIFCRSFEPCYWQQFKNIKKNLKLEIGTLEEAFE